MSKLPVAAAFALLCVTSCSQYKADGGKAGRDFAPDPASAFDVTAEITPAALAKLNALGDNLILDVSYYGLPTPASQAKANRLHQIDLGTEKVGVVLSAPKVHFTGRLDKAGIADVAAGEVMVLVDGYSVTKVGAKDDQIHCSYYRDRLSMAQKMTAKVVCDLETAN